MLYEYECVVLYLCICTDTWLHNTRSGITTQLLELNDKVFSILDFNNHAIGFLG